MLSEALYYSNNEKFYRASNSFVKKVDRRKP